MRIGDLDGLHNLSFIGERISEEQDLEISFNANLKSVDGLETI